MRSNFDLLVGFHHAGSEYPGYGEVVHILAGEIVLCASSCRDITVERVFDG
ncbi:Hypothetical protein FKW44_022265, partial [Caligus rogercresseyi]